MADLGEVPLDLEPRVHSRARGELRHDLVEGFAHRLGLDERRLDERREPAQVVVEPDKAAMDLVEVAEDPSPLGVAVEHDLEIGPQPPQVLGQEHEVLLWPVVEVVAKADEPSFSRADRFRLIFEVARHTERADPTWEGWG